MIYNIKLLDDCVALVKSARRSVPVRESMLAYLNRYSPYRRETIIDAIRKSEVKSPNNSPIDKPV